MSEVEEDLFDGVAKFSSQCVDVDVYHSHLRTCFEGVLGNVTANIADGTGNKDFIHRNFFHFIGGLVGGKYVYLY